jgi:hypothetical protein
MNVHHQLNSSMLGRCVLAMASGYDEAVEPIWPNSAILAMAGVFEQLAAEITVLTQNTPQLTAEDFARLLLEEVDPGEEDDDDFDDDHSQEWHQHPSLSAEERN